MKKAITIISVLLGCLILGYFVLDYVAQSKLKDFLDREQQKGQLSYSSCSADIFSGSARIKDIQYYRAADTIRSKKIAAEGFSLMRFLTDDEISLDQIHVERPKITLGEKEKSKNDSTSQNKNLKKTIRVNSVKIDHGSFRKYAKGETKFDVADFSIEFKDIEVSRESFSKHIPFEYGNCKLVAHDAYIDINTLEELKVAKFQLSDNAIQVDSIQMASKFSRENYIDEIPHEKDLIDLNLEALSIEDYNFKFVEDRPQFTVKKMLFSTADLSIYRDKTIKDDPRKKELYSGMLRKLPFRLKIDSLLIDQSKITYEEKMHKHRRPGKVFFEDVNVRMGHITNIGLYRDDFPSTEVAIDAQFMGTSPLNVDWSFKINDEEDKFNIHGSSSHIPPKAINPFFIPAFNVKAEGGINQLYFNFNGNKNRAQGDYKMVYKDFKVKVLRKHEKKKNGFLSFIANIFVRNNNEEPQNVRVSGVERDKTKSFWNYFWNCIQAGLKKTII